MDFDTSGLTPLDTTGLTPAGNDLDVSGLTPLDTSGLTPLDQQPAAKGTRGLDLEKVKAETPPPSPTATTAGAAGPESDAPSYLSNIGRGIGERAAQLAGGAVRFAGQSADQLADWLEQRIPLGQVTIGADGIGWRQSTPQDMDRESPLLPAARALEGTKFGYQARTTWEDVKRAPLSSVLPFALEQGLVSAPDMAAVLLNLPAYVAARTGEIGQTRAGNDGRQEATVGDFLAAAPAAVGSALLERLGARGILGMDDTVRAFKDLPGAVGKAALKEAGTEAGQEAIEYTGETAGTVKGWDPAEMGERALAGAVAGGPFGGGVRAATGSVQIASQPVEVAPPNVTPADVASPIPTDLISQGRSIVDELLAPKPAVPTEGAPNVADLPQGAVPAEVLLGQVAEPEPVTAPIPEAARQADHVIEAAPAALSVDGLTPLEPSAPLEAQAVDAAPQLVADQAVPVDGSPDPSASVAPAPMTAELQPAAAAPRQVTDAVGKIDAAPSALDVSSLKPLDEAISAPEVSEAPDDFPGAFRPSPEPASAPAPEATSASAPILKKDGTAFSTPQSAALAARSRPDLKGQALEPVQVEGGWGLRPAENAVQSAAQPATMKRPPSLFEFLASKGGIQDQAGELRALDLKRQFLPRQGALVRPTGLPLDRARELAEEAGYIRASDRAEGFGRTEIADLLEAIDREGRGSKVYPLDLQAEVAQQELARRQADEEASRRADAETGVRAVLEEHGVRLPEDLHRQAVEAAMLGQDHEDAAVEALERLAIQREADYIRESGADTDPFPFEDITDAQQRGIQQKGGVASAEGGGPEPAGVRENPEGVDRGRGGDGRRGEDRGQVGSGERKVTRATERTDQGEQFIVDGVRPATDRDRVEAAMAKPMQPKKRQKAADEGLFDVAGRGQSEMFSAAAAPEAHPARREMLLSDLPPDAPSVPVERNESKRWINDLSDADYQRLAEQYGSNRGGFMFPHDIAQTMEPARVLAEWKSFLRTGESFRGDALSRERRGLDPEAVQAFVDQALSTSDHKITLSLGEVTAEQVERIRRETGLDLTGYERVLDNYGLRHALGQHGNQKREAARGQEAITARDLERIPEIIADPDKVELVGRNGAGREVIRFTKRMGATLYYAEEVRTGKKQLVPQTMYKRPATPDAPGGTGSSAQTSESFREPGSNIGDQAAGAKQKGRGDDPLRLAPAFEQALPDIGTDLAARLQRYGIADRIGLKLVDIIRDRVTNEPLEGAVGRYGYGRRVIEVALNSNSRTFTLDHEVIHALRDLDLIRPAEWQSLRREVIHAPGRMADVRARYPEFTRWGDRPEATELLIEEAVADLFAEWQAGRVQAKGFVRTAMERIRDFLRAVGQTLRGLGFRTPDSVFRAIDRGEIGTRGREETAAADGLAEAHHAQMQPRDEQGRFVQGAPEDRFSIERDDTAAPAPQAAEARRSLMAKLAGIQPVDRVARIPFDLFGGVNARNEWRPGLYINRQAARILTEAKFADDGKLGWMSGILHRARAGLVDRYGLDAAYVERDRQRQLDERRIMAKVPELMKTLVDQDVKPEEMATLQAVLTGEEVADARWEGVAAPIRQAIDQMGAEAVELGLLSPEAFERNRGKYLHRVYAKHEADQGSLTAWVDRKMTGRRQRIIGDQFKGRGMFMEVSHGALMRNTDEAQTARERSGRLRALEKRRDELLRRREVALARTEERHDEMEATLDRRMDTSEGAKALKRPGGATVVLKPNRYQKGQAREQGVAMTRLNMKGQRARALVDRINGQLADVNSRIVETETRLFAADDLKAVKGQKFRVLDKLAELEDGKPPRVLHRAYLPEEQAIPKEMEGYQDRGVWEVRGFKGKDGAGKPILWRDFDKGERQSMGEIVDARYTVAKTYMLMAHDLSTGRFFRDIAASPEWSRDGKDEPPSATWKEAGEYSRFWADPAIQWVKVPDTKIPKSDTKRYGALAGRFVRAEIWRDMAELEAMQKPGFWDAVMRQWKANKTYRSPVVHTNNIMSNVMFMDMADVRATDLARGIRSLLKRDAAYREALDQGAFGSDLLAQEIREEVLKPILEEIEQAALGGQGGGQARFGVVGKLADRLWSGVKAGDSAMQRAYQMEDEVFRMALYLRRRDQGQSPQQAALDARDTFLNYDIRAPWVNAARRSVLPFIAYTYRAVPMIARTLATRPWKMAKYFTMMYALNALAYSLAPGDEDEERRSLRENEQGWAWTGVPRMMRLPTHDQHGNPMFLDVRRWIPAGDVFDMGQGQSVIPLPSWMQPGGPLAIGAELLLNRSAFTGQDIVNEHTDTLVERAGKTAGYVYKSWMPSAAWMPGSWYWERIGNAINGARDWSGRPYSVPQAVASSVGIKVKPQDVQEGFAGWGREFDKTERELEALARRASRDRERGLLSETGFQRQIEDITKKMGELDRRRKETFTGSSR